MMCLILRSSQRLLFYKKQQESCCFLARKSVLLSILMGIVYTQGSRIHRSYSKPFFTLAKIAYHIITFIWYTTGMIVLPPLVDKTKPRPNRPDFEETYLVPDIETYTDFWQLIYKAIRTTKLYSPVQRNIQKYINSLFGYFGFRVHPVTHESRYFHAGISLDLKAGRKIYPVLPGILEYSGYGAVNGYYVLLSHPQIQTEDGYVFHSMYCHLKKPLIKFNSYQKMLREISLHSHPRIPVSEKDIVGLASTSGVSRDNHPGLYLQFSFRKFDTKPIVIDPVRSYFESTQENESANITNPEIIKELFK